MESIPENVMLQFKKDTLESVRKDYNLNNPGVLNQAIDSLEEWVKKQNHFVKKDFPRDYLERMIIAGKGSVERAKKKFDKACTLRTLMPAFYETMNFETDYKDSNTLMGGVLPKLTRDHHRVWIVKINGAQLHNGPTDYFRFVTSLSEYNWAHEYCRGLQVVVDCSDAKLVELLKQLDITEFRQFITLLIEAYAIRLVGIHIVSSSKAIETIIAICKQILKPKIFERIQIHKDITTLCEVIEKDVLPIEQGGNEKSLREIHEKWLHVLSSRKHQEYFNNMKKAVVDETFRQTDTFKNDYMGIAGSFRTLSVD